MCIYVHVTMTNKLVIMGCHSSASTIAVNIKTNYFFFNPDSVITV